MDSTRPGVFVLEDDQDSREVLAEILEAALRVRTVAAASFAEMEAATDLVLGCSLALLDINLGPGQPSGADAYRWLVGHAFRGRVVFVTGHARDNPLIQAAIAGGQADLIIKPLGLKQLRALIEDLPPSSASSIQGELP